MNTNPAKPRILLVDDQETVRVSFKYALETWYDVIAISNVPDALEILAKERFDLVLLDILVPEEKDGVDALKTISAKYPDLPVVIASGSIRWEQKWEQLKELGAFGYLVKPFNLTKDKQKIDRCLRGERMDNPWG